MKIPAGVLALFEAESEGLAFGLVRLELHLRDGHPRFTLCRERSIIPETDDQTVRIPAVPSAIIGRKASNPARDGGSTLTLGKDGAK